MVTDIIVVGGGHAGIEAAYIASKKPLTILLITGNLDFIGQMSCNPSIGGVSKGNLVREVDALGGTIAKNIDKTGIHFKMLNTSKGMAVWGNRAQADKELYRKEARKLLESRKNVFLLQGYVKKVLCKGESVNGVILDSGETIYSKAVILTMGTFLNGIIHIGLNSFDGGRIGEPSSYELTKSINDLGIKSGRLKTGTSPRIDGRTVDFSKFAVQQGDEKPWPFSFQTEENVKNRVDCWIGKTNEKTHKIILDNLDRSPLYTGKIKSIGPKYCPSIEDKIIRFGERDGHSLFLEPENISFNEIYINGLATSLPFDVQYKIVKSIPGLENARIVRPGYGIEYDFFQPTQLKATLESKIVKNLFFAGQINGTSGYEEAAGQGIIAGINAAQNILQKDNLVLGRELAYIGVLIDDLIRKGTEEPYRMFTSRAEYRLLLRQDNSDERLMPVAEKLGYIEKELFERRERVWNKKKTIFEKIKKDSITVFSNEKKSVFKVSNYLKRPEITFNELQQKHNYLIDEDEKLLLSIEADIKYDGFQKKEKTSIITMKKMEKVKIPENFNYSIVEGVLLGSKNKLDSIKPETLGQASRIPGITPADIYNLAIHITNHNIVSRETSGSSL